MIATSIGLALLVGGTPQGQTSKDVSGWHNQGPLARGRR
jgi:hypothetical protein